MVLRQIAVQINSTCGIGTSIDKVSDEDYPTTMNIGQSRQLPNNLPELVRLTMDITNHRNGSINTLGNRGHETLI
jgi:hypothetical protein